VERFAREHMAMLEVEVSEPFGIKHQIIYYVYQSKVA